MATQLYLTTNKVLH